jgi:5'-3' exoribonuclease 2
VNYEYKLRHKIENRYFPVNTSEEKSYKLNVLPSTHRNVEHYIHADKENWQRKYYTCLFDIEYIPERLHQVCTNYMEALEWTWKYYTDKCYDWRWSYSYDYAPLFTDIKSYVPYFEFDFIKENPVGPINEVTQLIYVLPKESHHLLPSHVQSKLSNRPEWFDKSNMHFKWHYCKYLWESHIELPDIDINYIEQHITRQN